MVYRRALQLRPVKSLKHIVDIRTGVTTGGAVTTVPLIEAVGTPALATPTEVADGSTVSSIYLRVEAVATNTFALQPALYMIVYKDPGNHLADDPAPSGTGTNENKRWVIHQEMIMLAQTVDTAGGSFPRTMFNGVIKIPRSLKRNGFGDKLKLLLGTQGAETTGTANICVQCIYKEFR